MAKPIEQVKASLRKRLPKLTNKRIATLSMPFSKAPIKAQLKFLNICANRLFKQAIINGELDFLTGNYVNIEILELEHSYCISLHETELEVTTLNSNPDATFKFAPTDGILIAAGEEDPDTLFFQRRLIVEGDTELGLEVKNFLGCIDTDELPAALNNALKLAAEKVEH